MTSEAIGFWGCERSGYLDLWNNQRTVAYVVNNSPQVELLGPGSFDTDISAIIAADSVPTTVPSLTTFTNPADDKAWWYNLSEPQSAGFLGMQVDRIDGLESNVIDQQSDTLLDHLQTFKWNRTRNKGFTITVEAYLYGMSCCSVAYGLRLLRKMLAGCCDDGCAGTRLRLLEFLPGFTLPPTGAWTPPSVAAVSPWRTLHNVKLVEQPSIISGSGINCGSCGCNPITQITFTLRSQGELYVDPVPLLYRQALTGGGCSLSCSPTCATPPNLTRDPNLTAGPLPKAPNAVLSAPPPIVSQQYQVITFPSARFDSELELAIFAGSVPMYGITVKAWPYNPSVAAATGLYNDCNVCQGFAIPYIGAGVTYTRKVACGLQVAKPPYIQDARGTMLDWRWLTPNPSMRYGGQQWLVSIEADSGVASDAWLTLNAVMVEP